MNKKFRILSIDGGGIKGLYSAAILEKFESKFNTCTSDHFDMICGTSTGGLIALGLSLKIPAKDISLFYEKKGEAIFPRQNDFISVLKQTFLSGKYNNKGLKKALYEVLGDKKIKDSNNLLCIPSYSLTEHKPVVFKYDHSHLNRDNDTLMRDVALATSAAPTYFPLAELESYDNNQFIDGGVWANNPSLVGLLEALTYFVGEDKAYGYEDIEILSISSLSISNGNKTGLKKERSFLDWKAELFDTYMNGHSFFVDYFLSQIYRMSDINIDYTRIPSPPISKSQEDLIKMDFADEKAFDLMRILAKNQAFKYEIDPFVEKLFTTPKTFFVS